MADPDFPGTDADDERAPVGPATEADVRGPATNDVDPDDMFDPMGA